jgi:prepilin-type N-terminal cleavage/methylation domain-containing protein
MKRKAFTLIELMAAVGMLALIVAFMSIIFRVSIDAHRVSVANAEIMQKARAITEQLNQDFQGLRKDAPLLIWFKQDDPTGLTGYPGDITPQNDPNRYDQIMFFATGDFSTQQMYEDVAGSEPLLFDSDLSSANTPRNLRSNLARIHYTHATNVDEDAIDTIDTVDRNLSRRTHILFTDTNDPDGWDLEDWPDFKDFDRETEDYYEHDTLLMTDWKYATENDYQDEVLPNMIVEYHPIIERANPDTLHLLFGERIGSFAVQLGYWGKDNNNDKYELRWFPSDNPNGDNDNTDSHFDIDDIENEFGLYFNIPDINDITDGHWYSVDLIRDQWDDGDERFIGFRNYPAAIKFTFNIYDRKQVIEGGKTFTRIVDLDD